ncbi:MAG: hypothetical protein QGG73_09195 [Candidatus Hydrogenedentes bacterium]|nr:hypothetical protein [Candidatus Hydrogenedentota bacterium]
MSTTILAYALDPKRGFGGGLRGLVWNIAHKRYRGRSYHKEPDQKIFTGPRMISILYASDFPGCI